MIEIRDLDDKRRRFFSAPRLFERQQQRTVRSTSGSNRTTGNHRTPQDSGRGQVELQEVPLVISDREARLNQHLAISRDQRVVLSLVDVGGKHCLWRVARDG